MIETLLLSFARSMAWSVGKHAGRRLTRRIGWLFWIVIAVVGVAIQYRGNFQWTVWLHSLLQRLVVHLV